MTTITASDATQDARNRPRLWRHGRTREALTQVARKGTAMVGAARHHNWSPALTISGLGFIDTATWTSYGHGAGLLAIGLSALIYDWSRDR